MSAAIETIDGGSATPAELRRVGIDALVKALGPVGMARFLQQFDPGHGDYTAQRYAILGNPTVDERGMERLVDVMKKTGGRSFENGLSAAENQRLAGCHRPSEIATLVSLGLGRRFSGGATKT